MTWLYVGVLYAVAIFLVRRSGIELPRRVAVLFYALVLLFLWRPLTGDEIIVPADVVKLLAPWSEELPPNRHPVTKYEVSNLNLHDVPMQIVPWMHQVRESWRSWEVPLWNADAGCGYPLLANGQSTPLSPLRLLTQPLPLGQAVTAEAAMKLLLALVLTYLFCRRRYSPLASVLGAIVFAFSTWTTTWLQFPIVAASALLPGVLLAIDLLLERVTRRRFAAAAILFAVTVLSGHPETVYHVSLIAVAYGLWLVVIERRTATWRGLLAVAGASAVAALLAAPFLLPFAEAVLRSQRFSEMSVPRASLIPPYSDFPSSVLLLQPRFFGQLPIERPWGPTTLESISGFAGALALASWVAAAIYIVLRRRWRERETLYLLGALLSAGIVLGWPGITEAFHAVAGLAPAMRMRLGICWFASLLVAAAVDWSRRDTVLPLLGGTLAVAAAMLWLMHRTQFPSPSHRDTALLSLFPSIAVLLALTVPKVRFQLAGLLTIAELFLAIGWWHPVMPSRELYPPTPLTRKLQELRRDPAPFRILGTGGQLYPNVSAIFGIEDVRVHDPMADARYVKLLSQQVGWDPSQYYMKWNDTSTPLIDYLNVRYVLTEPAQELTDSARYTPLYAGRDGRIYENRTVLPRFFAVRNVIVSNDAGRHTDWRYTALIARLPKRFQAQLTAPWTGEDARVDVEQSGVDRYTLHIQSPRPALVVSSIPNWPGWRAGKLPAIEVNGGFFAFVAPAGDHTIEVSYRPASFYASSAIALLTLAALLVLSRRRRSDRLPSAP